MSTSYDKHDEEYKKMNYDVLLRNLMNLKKSNKHSYEKISNYIGCAKSTCYCYFNGENIIPIDRLIMLSKLYNQDLDKLCGKN